MSVRADIVVVGAGAAGIAASVSAARAGAKTLLMDQNAAVGGTGGFSGLTTICGLYDDAGIFLNDGFVAEFAEALKEATPLRMGKVWVLRYRAEKFRETAARLIANTPQLQPVWNAPVKSALLEGNRIAQLNGIEVGAVIDCTGTAEVARAVGADCLVTDETTQAPAIVFPLCNVTRELGTAAEVAQVLLPLARAGFPCLNLQPCLEPNTLTAKFTGTVEQIAPLIEFLRRSVAGFENCSTPVTEFVSARRAGRMIVGKYVLTGADVLAGRKFPDAVAKCAWPIEQWSRDGVARFKYLPTGTHYEIPARCLQSAKIENLFMAGKTMSADVEAIASARVMGCCLATGAAAGNLAAAYIQSGRTR
ncbi:MAG TPA: FAD-dependent oxidoreductase [Verrucomicrobiae bacterium]|nr:FAD-dependent oxidoreductase [Verrucomicrobiae bacterium]